MLWRLRRRLNVECLNYRLRGVLETAPIEATCAPCTFVSMVAKADVPMYLLAIKSLHRRVGGGAVVAILRSDEPASMRETLRRHVRRIELVNIEDIDVGRCQRGGCWERLCYVLDRSRDQYVVQVDSDTLALGGDVADVTDCIRRNRAFTMAGSEHWDLHSMLEAAAEARTIRSDHVGIAAERSFVRYPGCEGLRYVRGSAGFAGFARDGFPPDGIQEFHQKMERLMGSRWREWGTEQCASNFAIANSPDPLVLPFPAYQNHGAHALREGAQFVHFIGTNRYRGGTYARLGGVEIARLLTSA